LPVRQPALLCAVLAVATACHRGAKHSVDLTPPILVSGQATIPYPPELYARRIEGEVMLYLVIDSAGSVVRDSTRIVKSSGQAAFDAAALEAVPALRFAPAQRGMVPLTAPIRIPIRFALPDSLKNARDHK
jgi:TonB family protein